MAVCNLTCGLSVYRNNSGILSRFLLPSIPTTAQCNVCTVQAFSVLQHCITSNNFQACSFMQEAAMQLTRP